MAANIKVRNFQSISDADITVDGFTILVGESSQGKSACMHVEFEGLKAHFRQSGRINQLRDELRFQMAADFIVGIRPAAEETK